MRRLLQCLLGAMLSLMATTTFAQQRTITGTVISSENKETLPGVSVKVQGKEGGVITDLKGKFSIVVPSGSTTLLFTYLGYSSKTETIGASDLLNVSLSPDPKLLNEVVVTALGIKRTRRDLGYSTQNVKGDQLVDRGDNNIINALQGKVAGVDITGASGSAGASTNIILRGVSSITGSNQPLFVIDGIPISNDVDQVTRSLFTNQPSNRAMDIDPNTIESINILQGPAGAALYGSRASAGAIIITTKKGSGQNGTTNISFNTAFGVQNVYGFPKLQNQYGAGANGTFNATAVNSFGPAFGSTPSLLNGLIVSSGTGTVIEGVNYNPGDAIPYINYPDNMINYFSQGRTWDNNLAILNGNAKNNYGLTIGNSVTNGILPVSDFDKLNIKFNAGAQLTKKLNLNGAITYFNTFQNGATTQGSGVMSGMDQLFSVTRSTNLAYYKANYKNADGTMNWFVDGRDNPYFVANENAITSRLNRFQGNVNLSYDILDWLKVSYRLGIDTYSDRRRRFIAIGSTQEAASSGSIAETSFFRSEINGDLIITANREDVFTKGLKLTALLGQNINSRDYQGISAASSGLNIPGFENVSNGQVFSGTSEDKSKKRLLGYYGQLSLGYKEYLFLEFTGRVDQSSTLPKANNTYFYPSISSSFIFSDALKLKSDVFSYGKIRASYARVGKDANPYVLDAHNYDVGSYGNNVALFNFPYGSTLGFTLTSLIGNQNLKPEFTAAYELGLNLGFFNDRLNFEGTIYKQGSKNQIINAGIAPSSGFLNMVTNIGEISNKGIELLVNAVAVKSKNFSWDISANFSKNKNKVVSLAPGVTTFSIANGNNYAAQIPSAYVGLPYGVILGNKQPRSPAGDLIVDANTGLYSTAVISSQLLADPNRDWSAGLSNNFKIKDFTLSTLVDLKVGGDISSWTSAILRSRGDLAITAEDRDKPHILKGVIANADGTYSPNNIQIPAQLYWQSGFGGIGGTEFNIFDATTFRIREIAVGYNLKGAVLKSKLIKSIKLTLYARNLYYYAPNSPIDPEVNTQGAGNIRGIELQSAPNTRNFGASLRVAL